MIDVLMRINIPYEPQATFLTEYPFVWQAKLTKDAAGYGPYYRKWVSDSINTRRLEMGSVVVDQVRYDRKFSLEDCINDDQSFYWSTAEQTIFIHVVHSVYLPTASLSLGLQGGYSKNSVHYINDIEYPPLIATIPAIKKKTDKFQVSRMSFQDQKVKINNGEGQMDGFFSDPVPGAEASLIIYDSVTGFELPYFTGFVTEDSSTVALYGIKLQDKRRRENTQVPKTRFETGSFPLLESKYKDQIIPEGYGAHNSIPCIPLNGRALSGDIAFQYASDGTVLTEVRSQENDVWSVVIPTISDPLAGTFSLSYADATNSSGGINTIVCDAILRAQTNPGDILADMNQRYNSIQFDATNYDLVEWASEAAKLDDITLYMDEEKAFFEWVEVIQNGSDYWVLYDITGDGRRSLRLNDPNRPVARTIGFYEIKNDDLPVERDFTEFSSTVTVLYAKDWIEDRYERVVDTTYQDQVLAKYLYPQDNEFESLLPTLEGATRKAALIAEDQKDTRPVSTVILHEKDISALTLKLYDILNVELSDPGKRFWERPPYEIVADYTGPDEIIADYTGPDEIVITFGEYKVIREGREYWGTIRGQLLEISYAPDTLSYKLVIRERPESEVA